MNLLQKLSEESTWRGLIQIATAFGVMIRPELAGYIISGGLGIVGIINSIKKQK